MQPFAKPAVTLDGLHVHGPIVHDQRVGEHVGIPRDGRGLRRGKRCILGRGVGWGQEERNDEGEAGPNI